MKARRQKPGARSQNELLARADEMLDLIANADQIIKDENVKMVNAIEDIKNLYVPNIAYWQRHAEAIIGDLITLMKKNSEAIFEGEERVELKHGSLLFTIEERVKRVRNMLENLKAQGFKEAIIISESVDWDLIEKWPAERLALVGTKKGRKEVFNYELKERVA